MTPEVDSARDVRFGRRGRGQSASRIAGLLAASLVAAAGLLATWVGACDFPEPQVPPGVAVRCAADGECTEAGKAVCDLSIPAGPAAPPGVCVQCTPQKASACTGTTPVCGADSKACRACEAHAECTDSVVCEAAGSCAVKGKVLYAAPAGLGTVCTKEAPCSLSTALGKVTATQNLIKLAAGTYMVNVDLDGNQRDLITFTVNMVAEPGTKLQALVPGTPVLRLHNEAKLELADVELSGSTAATVKLESKATLTLTRGKVVGGTIGVHADDGSLTLDRSEVTGGSAQSILVEKAASQVTIEQSQVLVSGGPGIEVADGELVISRSMVRGNIGGGVVVNGMNRKVTITNSFIVKNTGAGGIRALYISATSKIDFNTIVDNVGGTSSSSAGGVICDRPTINLTGNIVFRNIGGPDTLVQEFGDCTYNGSLVLAGNGPMDQRPKFVAELDWHLAADAPATVRNVAGVTCSGVDYDGDARPLGGACELGADELKP